MEEKNVGQQQPSILLNTFNDGVIAFEEETARVSKFLEACQSYFSKHDSIGSQVNNHIRSYTLKTNVSDREGSKWFSPGIPCSILSPTTDGWQSGKVRIKLQVTVEFYPEDPAAFGDPPSAQGSPLDDLRGDDSAT